MVQISLQLAQMQKAVAGLDKKISNPGFLAKSTPEVQQELKQKLELKQEEVKVLEESIQVLLSMFSPEKTAEGTNSTESTLVSAPKCRHA